MGEPIDAIETRLRLIQAALKRTVLVKFERGKEEIGGGGYRMRFPFDEQPTEGELVINVYAVIGALANLKAWERSAARRRLRQDAHRSATRPRPEQCPQTRVPTNED